MYLTEEELPYFSARYMAKLEELGVPNEEREDLLQKFLKSHVIIKYSKQWQDNNLNEWIKLIQEVPGGYWQVQELIHQPHVEYEHYKFKQKMSYEKGNVSKHRANIELKEENREVFNFFHDKRHKEGVVEINVEGDITIKTPKDL